MMLMICVIIVNVEVEAEGGEREGDKINNFERFVRNHKHSLE